MNDCLYCAENESAIESLRARLATAEAVEAAFREGYYLGTTREYYSVSDVDAAAWLASEARRQIEEGR